MFCPKCGTQVDGPAQFCPSCGQQMGGPAPAFAAAAAGPFVPPTSVDVQAWKWIGQGWDLVKQDWLLFGLMAVVFFFIQVVPFVLQGALTVGFHFAVMRKILTGRLDFADLFKGFDYFVPALVASLIIAVFGMIGTLLCIIPGIVVAASLQMTYLFILDRKMDFWPAIQASHDVAKQNYVGFTLFLLALVLVHILGFLACFVGLFLAFPIHIAAVTFAYKEIVGFETKQLS